jgi:long-chain acyl-CoA synthetase
MSDAHVGSSENRPERRHAPAPGGITVGVAMHVPSPSSDRQATTFGRRHRALGVDAIAHNARVFPRKTAVVCDGRRLTWPELDKRVNQVANVVRDMGVRKGDKVVVAMDNSIELMEIFWGVVKAGGVIVPANTMLDDDALVRVITSCGAVALLADASTAERLDRYGIDGLGTITSHARLCSGGSRDGWRDADALIAAASVAPPNVTIEPDDSMTVMYSSGSTGSPKGIEHSHGARMVYPLGFGLGLKIDRYSVGIVSTPLHASGSWITIFPLMYRGGTTVLLRSYSPGAFLKAVEEEGVTHAFMVPTMYIMLLECPEMEQRDCSSLQVLLTSGQAFASATADELRRRVPKARLQECWGLTEGLMSIRLPEDEDHGKGGSVGKPLLLDDLRIVDAEGNEVPQGETGEIVGYGSGLMKGYLDDPERTRSVIWTAPDGLEYLRTGDAGHIDEDGYLYVSGRLKDMIKSGGINIYATDIEDVFMQHPAVSEAAAIAVSHEKWGETPLLVVVPKPGVDVDAEELRAWGNDRLAKYQRVSGVVLQDDMPRATYGKVHKDRLREQFRDVGTTTARAGRST